MSCIKITTKKYKTRKSPPYHANDCKGLTKKGNDGNEYISSPDKRGIFKWVLKGKKVGRVTQKQSVKTYTIQDNGGQPFVVEVSPKSVTILRQKFNDESETYSVDKTVGTFAYKRIFIGDNLLKDKYAAPKGKWPGNSILLEVGDGKYIYIGHEIYSLETKDKERIVEYFSPVGNSMVPYPYAVGENNTYFMLDKKLVPNPLLDLKKDGYGQFYGHTINDEEHKKKIDSAKKRFKTKMIHKRFY